MPQFCFDTILMQHELEKKINSSFTRFIDYLPHLSDAPFHIKNLFKTGCFLQSEGNIRCFGEIRIRGRMISGYTITATERIKRPIISETCTLVKQ